MPRAVGCTGAPGTSTFEDNALVLIDGMGFPGTERMGHTFRMTTTIDCLVVP